MAALDDEIRNAAENGDIPALTNWLSRGGDANQLDEQNGWGMLHNIFDPWPHERNDRSEAARLLIAHGADINLLGRDDVTPLHLSAFPGETDLLLDLGAYINAVDRFGCTPLFTSATVFKPDNQKAAIAFARLLLRRGADVFVKDKQGYDVESIVRARGNNEVADLFAQVKAAGSWPRYVRAPRVSLVRLRLLCSRGRARPPTARRDPILARLFAAPPPASSNKRLASRQVHRPLPNEIFWLVLSFWRTDRD